MGSGILPRRLIRGVNELAQTKPLKYMTTIEYLIQREYQRLSDRLTILAADAQVAAAQPRRFALARHLSNIMDGIVYSQTRIDALCQARDLADNEKKPSSDEPSA